MSRSIMAVIGCLSLVDVLLFQSGHVGVGAEPVDRDTDRSEAL